MYQILKIGLSCMSTNYTDVSIFIPLEVVGRCSKAQLQVGKKYISTILDINPCPAKLFQLYFSSFGAGIANAISSSK